MLQRIEGVVLDLVKHNERHNVVTLFTRERGRVSLLSPTGQGRNARLRNSQLMPLSVITADINFNPAKELQILGRFQRTELWRDIYFNPTKSAVTMFLTEFLNTFLRESGPDAATFDFIVDAIRKLDDPGATKLAPNFHIAFLIEFLRYAGITPDLAEWREDALFDMQGGTMVLMPPRHRDYLLGEDVAHLPLLSRMTLSNCRAYRFNGAQRRRLLTGLLRYYSLHFPGLGNLKSPTVLAEVFS